MSAYSLLLIHFHCCILFCGMPEFVFQVYGPLGCFRLSVCCYKQNCFEHSCTCPSTFMLACVSDVYPGVGLLGRREYEIIYWTIFQCGCTDSHPPSTMWHLSDVLLFCHLNEWNFPWISTTTTWTGPAAIDSVPPGQNTQAWAGCGFLMHHIFVVWLLLEGNRAWQLCYRKENVG